MPKVSDIGERALIQRIIKQITPMPEMPIPFWDDASAVSMGDGRSIVINTDMLVWETDIPIGMTPFQAARKSVIMNVSDLGAKGVQPIIFMPNIGIPWNYDVEKVEEMARGFETGAREYGAYVVGGDTNEACDVIISGLALGIAEENHIMKRDGGALPGHHLAVTGNFGLTSIGFMHLLKNVEIKSEVKKEVLEAVYMPKARVREGVALAETRVVTSCMDSSDGLSLSLYDLRKSIGYGFIIENPPVHQNTDLFAKRLGLDPLSLAFAGGEEYELIFTYPPEKTQVVQKALQRVGCDLIEIGVVSDKEHIVIKQNDRLVPIEGDGWEHFTK
jgi:thiamine-monophosphate kinase